MKGWLESFLDLVFPEDPLPPDLPRTGPHFCAVCGEGYDGMMEEGFRCMNCRGRRWYVRCARAAYRAEGGVREMIHEFKYNGHFHHLPRLTAWLVEGYERFYRNPGEKWDAIVPVPLYPLRRRERGFNQAEELGRGLSRETGLPLWTALRRTRQTAIQARLRRSERLRNQSDAYELKSGFDVRGKRLLIVDDVFTTGATINACAQALSRSGAGPLAGLTVARG